MSSHDAIVIGSGQAGRFLAVRLAQSGLKVALIEREHYGGNCVNDGCVPIEALIASARTAHVARRAAEYGVSVGGAVTVDLKAVMVRKDRIVQQSIDSLTQWLRGTAGLDLVHGHACFSGPNGVEVNGQALTAPKIFINVGGRAELPDWPGMASVPVLTNTSMMSLDVLPEHLIVVSGSYIGLEFAQMFRRFGSQVSVLEVAGRWIAREGAAVSAEVQASREREGVRNARAQSLGEQIHVLRTAGGALHEVIGSHLLAAVGRRPNTDDLGLQIAAIATDVGGFIVVDDQLRTKVPGNLALGDANGRGTFTHASYNDFEVVAANLLDGMQRSVNERIPAYALFTDPPLGRVGMTEAQVRAAGRAALVGVMPMSRVGRAKERGEAQGFMKVLVDAQTERILSASLLCIEGDEIVHSLPGVMAADVSYRAVQRAVHIHPTLSELIPTLLGRLAPLPARPARQP